MTLNKAAQQLGALGGAVKSKAKAKASRANGKLGGRRKLIDRVNGEYLTAVMFYMCFNGDHITKARAIGVVNYHIKLSDDVGYFQEWKEDKENEDYAEDLAKAERYVAKFWPNK